MLTVLIDYESGNLHSAEKAFQRMAARYHVVGYALSDKIYSEQSVFFWEFGCVCQKHDSPLGAREAIPFLQVVDIYQLSAFQN